MTDEKVGGCEVMACLTDLEMAQWERDQANIRANGAEMLLSNQRMVIALLEAENRKLRDVLRANSLGLQAIAEATRDGLKGIAGAKP